ncbi:unnamed protein product [Ambrosiozyma monospora]|uniref:Unnamed protein product n=1 Tax=Ambrosiozyma monospora TaxID=43982 RepID=A0ACB5TS00_AMBMO|nr:unnamed protein product [Ambrosiozyma monospora]
MVNSTAAHLSSSLKYLHTSESKHPTQQSSASTSTIDQPLHSVMRQRKNLQSFLVELLQENECLERAICVNFDDKPNVATSLARHIDGLEAESIAVIACGPKQLNADVRLAVVQSIKNNKNVEYHEEELLW